jgi:hypothetical protein
MADRLTFTVHETEMATLLAWKAEHEKTCKYLGPSKANPAHMYWFTPSSPVTYSFTSTGIGDVVEIKCLCGETKDITDYELW